MNLLITDRPAAIPYAPGGDSFPSLLVGIG